MYTKALYVLVDILAIAAMVAIIPAVGRIKSDYSEWLRRVVITGIVAIAANICIALSPGPLLAEVSYCLYFASIDWLIFYLTGFSISYTEHEEWLVRIKPIAASVMGFDTISIFANLIFKHNFYIFEKLQAGTVFYQTGFYTMYYVHLAIDYIAVLIAFLFIILGIRKSYGLYRMKYVMILSVLILVVVLNVIYMTFSLVLDASVICYALAATLIYFSVAKFVPRSLLITSTDRAVGDMNEGLILFDINDTCIYANRFSRERFDIDTESYDFSCEPIRSVVSGLKEQGKEFGEFDYVMRTAVNGKFGENHYRIKYNDLTDKKGRTIGSFFLIEDTTETFHYMNEINEAKISADQANQAKSSFLANMSHEIRTPLNSVLGMNEMILRSTDDPQLLEYAENIRSSGEVLLDLINDILDFSKIEARKMDVVRTEYNIHSVLSEICNYFEHAAATKDLYMSVDCDDSIPLKLSGDNSHIRRILINIVSNAIKYTNEGGITINVSWEDIGKGYAIINISVKDTGIGIDPDDIPYMFDAFKRINEKQNASIQGTGLGLAITKELTELMNGSIEVESAPGKGSCFTVMLPQVILDSAPAGPYVRNREPAEDKYHETFTSTAHILIVDDVALNLKVAEALLRKTGITIDRALGGAEAIRKCSETKYDLVLLDHRMPDPDGVETFRTITSDGPNTDTPIIMMTAHALKGAEEEYIKMGFADYIAKPIKSKQFEETLLRHLPADKVTRSDQAPV